MARIFAWCDAPTAHTGFGRSAQHILHALHDAGHTIVQLAVNLDPVTVDDIPWKVYSPTLRESDPYGLNELGRIIMTENFDMMWTTFDPEIPWKYQMPGSNPAAAVMDILHSLKQNNPGFRTMGWFPVDGGPLSSFEEAVLGAAPYFDVPATMASHVHGLLEWTLKLRGDTPDTEEIKRRLRIIPHGVDLSKYAIATDEERRDAKRRIGVDPDTYVILQLERNQQRKINWMGHEVMEHILRRRPALRGKAVLYQHMLENEESGGAGLGYDLPTMAPRYGLQRGRDVVWPKDGGVPEEEMSRTVYASADVFLSTSTGEGFQYPAWEALACGVPLVVPNDSARAAWLTGVANVHLYETARRSHVMRGGYARRMGFPNAAKAAQTIMSLMDAKRPKFQRRSEEGRAFVKRVADLPKIQKEWVDIAAEQEEILIEERREAKIAVTGDVHDFLVTMMHSPGHGDMTMAGPALAALRKHGTVKLRVQRDRLQLAQILGLADAFETHCTPGTVVRDKEFYLHELYYPGHTSTWGDPNVSRALTIARFLKLDDEEILPFAVTPPEEMVRNVRGQFLEQFGVDPSSCVALAFDAGNPQRSLPRGYLKGMFPLLRGIGLTPLLVGNQKLGVRTHDVLDLTGQTDMNTLLCVLSCVSAVVSADSGIMHLAAAVGTPTVGCFTLFEPDTRLKYYEAPTAAVIPTDNEVAGDTFPAGPFPKAQPGEWAASIKPDRIMEALRELLGIDEPKLTVKLAMPTDLNEGHYE